MFFQLIKHRLLRGLSGTAKKWGCFKTSKMWTRLKKPLEELSSPARRGILRCRYPTFWQNSYFFMKNCNIRHKNLWIRHVQDKTSLPCLVSSNLNFVFLYWSRTHVKLLIHRINYFINSFAAGYSGTKSTRQYTRCALLGSKYLDLSKILCSLWPQLLTRMNHIACALSAIASGSLI